MTEVDQQLINNEARYDKGETHRVQLTQSPDKSELMTFTILSGGDFTPKFEFLTCCLPPILNTISEDPETDQISLQNQDPDQISLQNQDPDQISFQDQDPDPISLQNHETDQISLQNHETDQPSRPGFRPDELPESYITVNNKITLFKLFVQEGPYCIDDNFMEFLIECLKKAQLNETQPVINNIDISPWLQSTISPDEPGYID